MNPEFLHCSIRIRPEGREQIDVNRRSQEGDVRRLVHARASQLLEQDPSILEGTEIERHDGRIFKIRGPREIMGKIRTMMQSGEFQMELEKVAKGYTRESMGNDLAELRTDCDPEDRLQPRQGLYAWPPPNKETSSQNSSQESDWRREIHALRDSIANG